MILQALTELYGRLLALNAISPPGWGTTKVSFALELDDNGEIIGLHSLKTEQESGKKTVLRPQILTVPVPEKRAVGIVANCLCDNAKYMLGADAKGKPERTRQCFEACRTLHNTVLADVDTPAATAVKAHFAHWSPSRAAEHPLLRAEWDELMAGGNIVFWYARRPVLDDPAIRDAWQRHYANREYEARMQCLVTGEQAFIPNIHMAIKGVRDAQSVGAALVSFNAPSLESYDREQNLNAPIGEYAAFAYATALNHLLADRAHTQFIGDTTVVYWAESGEQVYQDMFSFSMMGVSDSELLDSDVRGALKRLAQGLPIAFNGEALNPGMRFFVLGLAPNAARLSVRFFLQDTFGRFAANVERHYADIDIRGQKYYGRYDVPFPSALLWETVNRNARTPAPVPQLSGGLMRAILAGTPYPRTLLNQVLIRIRAEHDERNETTGNIQHRAVSRGRAAIIKAYYLRQPHTTIPKEVLTVDGTTASGYVPYELGHLFSVLESIQEASADGKLNSTIRDRYYNAACTTPRNAFSALLRLEGAHMKKLQRDKPRLAVTLEKRLTQIMGNMEVPTFPRMLNPEGQCAFHLGYYHETQKRYEKKEEKDNGGSDSQSV